MGVGLLVVGRGDQQLMMRGAFAVRLVWDSRV